MAANNTTKEKASDWYPTLTGQVSQPIEYAIRYLFKEFYKLRDNPVASPAALQAVTNVFKTVTAGVSPAPVPSAGGGGGGGTPGGGSGSGGGGGIGPPVVTALPPPGDPLSQIGQIVIYNGADYTYTQDTPGSTPFWKRNTSLGVGIYDTAANMANYPAANYTVGTPYYETDRGNVQYTVQLVGGVNTWKYFSGYYADILANIPVGLGANDVGFTFKSTDYQQSWQWNGSVWHFEIGSGSGQVVFANSPGDLQGGVWHLMDGTTFPVTQDDATLLAFASSIIANNYKRQ